MTLEEALGSVFNHAQSLYILQSSQCQRTPCSCVLQENSTSITPSDAHMICKYLPHPTWLYLSWSSFIFEILLNINILPTTVAWKAIFSTLLCVFLRLHSVVRGWHWIFFRSCCVEAVTSCLCNEYLCYLSFFAEKQSYYVSWLCPLILPLPFFIFPLCSWKEERIPEVAPVSLVFYKH